MFRLPFLRPLSTKGESAVLKRAAQSLGLLPDSSSTLNTESNDHLV